MPRVQRLVGYVALGLALATMGAAGAEAGGDKFYLTQGFFNGVEAPNSCAHGYHMASIWEIYDPSNLTYDTQRGFREADSGNGPPSNQSGWVRTGWPANSIINCEARSVIEFEGLAAMLAFGTSGAGRTGPYLVDQLPCDAAFVRVWCIEGKPTTESTSPR